MVMYSRLLLDLLDDWNQILNSQKRRLQSTNSWNGNDNDLACVLEEVLDVRCSNLSALNIDEVVAFLIEAYPRRLLYDIGKRQSKFLSIIKNEWAPDMEKWVATLWRFCGKACNLFAMVFEANRTLAGTDDTNVGHALFNVLPKMQFLAPGDVDATMESAMGALVTHIQENSLARYHEKSLYKLTKKMSPEETGFVVRHLLLFKSRPLNCQCGWLPQHYFCVCPKKKDFDPLKEYAFVLFRLVCDRRRGDFDSVVMGEDQKDAALYNNWEKTDDAKFVSSASDGVFSASTFQEICYNLNFRDECVPPPLKKPRMMSDTENNANFQSSFAQHKGCIMVSCKQLSKDDCLNVSCKKHCHLSGILNCKSHKKYNGTNELKKDLSCPVDYRQLLSRYASKTQF